MHNAAMKQLTTKEWTAQFLGIDPPRSKSLVMTVFGDTITPHGGSTWLGSLIALLEPFGINDRLLRTSVFRLVQEGWLVASRDGRRSSYAILPSAQARFARANARVFAPLARRWDGSWTLLFGTANGIDAPERLALRKELLWEGFAMLGPNLFGHPGPHTELAQEILQRTGLEKRLFVCRASDLHGVASKPLRELVADGWDLSDVTGRYERFCEQFRPLLALLEGGSVLEPEQAYMLRTLLVHAYRRVQLHDPMLPVELLPSPWLGSTAFEVARAVYRLSFEAAEEYVMALLRREDPAAPEADAGFYERFGGLY